MLKRAVLNARGGSGQPDVFVQPAAPPSLLPPPSLPPAHGAAARRAALHVGARERGGQVGYLLPQLLDVLRLRPAP